MLREGSWSIDVHQEDERALEPKDKGPDHRPWRMFGVAAVDCNSDAHSESLLPVSTALAAWKSISLVLECGLMGDCFGC